MPWVFLSFPVLTIGIGRRWAGKMEVLHRYRVHDEAQWIKALSWSPWQLRRKGE